MMLMLDYITSAGEYPFILEIDIQTPVEGKPPVRTVDFQTLLTEYITLHFGSLQVSRPDVVPRMCSIIYHANEYKYKTLWDTVVAEYNPLDNYDMTERTVTEMQGGELVTNSSSGTDSSNSTSGRTSTVSGTTSGTSSAHKTMSGGETYTDAKTLTDSGTETQGALDKTDTNSTSGYNESGLLDDSRLHSVSATVKNYTTSEGTESTSGDRTYHDREDTESGTTSGTSNSTDTVQETGETSGTHSASGTDRREYVDRSDIITHERHGNIGVMSTQQLIIQSRDIAVFSFLDVVAHDIISHIAIAIY